MPAQNGVTGKHYCIRASCSCGWAAWYGDKGMVPAAAADAACGIPHEYPGKDAAAYWDMAEAVEK